MTISLKHQFTSAVSDGGDATKVRPSNWNAEHTFTMATSRLLGRTTSGTGAAEEITVGTGLSYSATNLALTGGAYTSSPYTMATSRLLGRTTASTGAAEEISVTSPITLSGGSVGFDHTAIPVASVISGSTTSAALRITQTGTGNALLVEDSASTDSTPFVIDASGNVGIGLDSTSYKLQVAGSSGTPQLLAGTAVEGYFSVNAFNSNPVYCVVSGTTATAAVFGAQTNIPFVFFVNNADVGRFDTSGKLLIGTTTSGASKLTVNDDSIQVNTAKTPASASATGTTGQICWDSSYIYVCIATNTWRRVAHATW